MSSLQYYNRYNGFLVNDEQTIVPFVTLTEKGSDKRFIFRANQSRLDKISQQYYRTPFFGWLILYANPEFGGLENNIPDGSILNIPYPLITSLQDYKNALNNHFLYYGK